MTSPTIASHTWGYAIASYFFFKILDGTEVIKTTDILSPYVIVSPSNVTPNDQSMNLISNISSVVILDITTMIHR